MFDFRFILTRFQKKALEKALSVARNLGQYTVSNRIRSILAIAEGKGVGEIASILRVSPATIRQWLTKYLTGGLKALRTVHKQSSRLSRLTKTQKSQLLKNLGFSYQKACFSVGGKDPDNQRKREDWLSKTWSEILNQAEKENAYLLFGDEVSFPQWGSLTYTWAPKGQQPTVQTSGCRKGYKVFGLIDYFTGKFFYKTLEGRFNSESYKDFLWGVFLKTRKKIILIQDGARYHTSKAMKLFFDQFKHWVTVYQLPSYSPDYNPIEKLWKNIKTAEIHLHYFPTFDSLKQKVEKALLRHSNQQKAICNLFGFYHEIKVA
ncbi:IS630 family transposase [uncultured Desulfobacter sp.]|uniref:IS630 family transposase n=1 Tax=uncultured Desulfobacter sp. TaxID=240139 RepID=UPI002AAB453E|nr:IS630 family transposase [uncultured Desulfobacter sp.]